MSVRDKCALFGMSQPLLNPAQIMIINIAHKTTVIIYTGLEFRHRVEGIVHNSTFPPVPQISANVSVWKTLGTEEGQMKVRLSNVKPFK